MAIRLPYETKAGQFSEAETYLQLNEHLRLAAEAAYTLGHNSKANDDFLRGEAFLQFGRMLENYTKLALDLCTKGRMQ